MSNKNWYKIETNKGENDTYHYIGSSVDTYEIISDKIQKNEAIRLDDLLYMARGEVKEWADWDKSLIPSVLINPCCVITVMQFKGDPRVVPNK